MAKRNNAVRNKLEGRVRDMLAQHGVIDSYEIEQFEYEIPATLHTYTPDFKVRDDVFVEAKGLFDRDDRKKILYMQEQHPDVVICMAFYNADYKIYKGSKTTYGDWCNEHMIPWIDVRHESIPTEWLIDHATQELDNGC